MSLGTHSLGLVSLGLPAVFNFEPLDLYVDPIFGDTGSDSLLVSDADLLIAAEVSISQDDAILIGTAVLPIKAYVSDLQMEGDRMVAFVFTGTRLRARDNYQSLRERDDYQGLREHVDFSGVNAG